jgi:hypothetical protein
LLRQIERLSGQQELQPTAADRMFRSVHDRGSAEPAPFSRKLRGALFQWGRLRSRRGALVAEDAV